MNRKLVLLVVAVLIIVATSGCAGLLTLKPIFSQPCEMSAIVVGEGSARTSEVEPGGLLVLKSGEVAFLLVGFSQFSTEETFSWRVGSDLVRRVQILLDGESRAIVRAAFDEKDIAGTLFFEVRREDQVVEYHFNILVRGQSENPRVEIPSFPEPTFAGNIAVQVGWEDLPRTVEFGSTLRLDRGQIAAIRCPGWNLYENSYGGHRVFYAGRGKFYLIAVQESCEKLLFHGWDGDRNDEPASVYVIVDP